MRAPSGLKAPGKRLWRDVLADVHPEWTLDKRDLQWLEQAARTADRIAELEALLEDEGLTVRGSKGQSRLHPAVQEIRQSRQLLAAVLAKIELDPPAPKTGHLNGRQRAQLHEARKARWPRG